MTRSGTDGSMVISRGTSERRGARGAARGRAALVAALAGTALVIGGCNVESYMDPSVVGRWQDTPVKSPILDRIGSLEGAGNEGVETSSVRPDDLIPNIEAYRSGPGDLIELTVEDFYRDGVPLKLENIEVDPRGYIDLPQVGGVFVYGQTVDQMVASIRKSLSDAGVLKNATVNVIVRGRRKLTYNIIGEVNSPGTYNITKPDFRLMDALGAAGRFNQSTEFIYVIRLIPLSDKVTGQPEQPRASVTPGDAPTTVPQTGRPALNEPVKKPTAIDVIDELSKPAQSPAPALFRSAQPQAVSQPSRPVQPSAPLAPSSSSRRPQVDLIDPIAGKQAAPSANVAPAGPGNPAEPNAVTGTGQAPAATWQFVNGQWVQSGGTPAGGAPGTTAMGMSGMTNPMNPSAPMTRDANGMAPAPMVATIPPTTENGLGGMAPTAPTTGPLAPMGAPGSKRDAGQDLVTQRVIEIPLKALLAGSASYNIIIRPGDYVRVPAQNEGVFYLAGQVARPGPYQLPLNGKMTLLRAVDAGGGFSSTAIPERIDLTRLVGPDQQVTIKLNYRAISMGTHPDIVIRPDDRINVGTNFFAFPLAVLRNGLRASYGFGFILDRNFGFDVFGPQRTTDTNF
ncbi:hypothetical protein BH11PLA1_BH11PLA1_20510 [soil metagenome]